MSYQAIHKYCQEHEVTLVAVSKTKPESAILEMYERGQRVFGENKVQELVAKYEALPKDIQWHCIGHLQRNKVKYIAPFVSLIHSVDSLKLIKEINKQGRLAGRRIDVLLQFHIATEETKFGLDWSEAEEILLAMEELEYVNIRGVMGMATYTEDEVQVAQEFRTLRKYYEDMQANYFGSLETFETVSMGMSGDYKIAVEEGSTMIRIGSLLFGERG